MYQQRVPNPGPNLTKMDFFHNICRLCGNRQRSNISVLGEEGKKKHLKTKIELNIGIDVTDNDPLPIIVCRVCVERLDFFNKFRDKCHATQDLLMNKYLATIEVSKEGETGDKRTVGYEDTVRSLPSNLLANLKNEAQESSTEFVVEVEVETEKSGTSRSVPSLGFNQHTFLLSDRNKPPSDIPKIDHVIKIEYLGGQDTKSSSYIIVRPNVTDSPLSTIDGVLPKTPIQRLTTKNKDKIYSSLNAGLKTDLVDGKNITNSRHCVTAVKHSRVGLHKTKRKTEMVTSEQCAPKITRVPPSSSVRSMVEKIAPSEFKCKWCDVIFQYNYLCEYHVRRCHFQDKMPFRCNVTPDCQKTFVAMYMLTRHIKVVHSDHEFICKVCGHEFRSKKTLDAHEKVHTDPPKYVCEFCQKGFYFLTSYRGHLETHKERKDFVCDLCAKSYKSKRHLREHVARIHDEIKRFACTTCGKRFFRRTSYKNHIRLHTSERPYSCECGRMFNDNSNLVRHKKVHMKKRGYNISHKFPVSVETEEVSENEYDTIDTDLLLG